MPLSFAAGYRLAVFLEAIYKALHLKGEPALTKYTVVTLGTSQTLNIDKAKEKLGYNPLYSLQEGIETYGQSN